MKEDVAAIARRCYSVDRPSVTRQNDDTVWSCDAIAYGEHKPMIHLKGRYRDVRVTVYLSNADVSSSSRGGLPRSEWERRANVFHHRGCSGRTEYTEVTTQVVVEKRGDPQSVVRVQVRKEDSPNPVRFEQLTLCGFEHSSLNSRPGVEDVKRSADYDTDTHS
jgi:hypothetical protein